MTKVLLACTANSQTVTRRRSQLRIFVWEIAFKMAREERRGEERPTMTQKSEGSGDEKEEEEDAAEVS